MEITHRLVISAPVEQVWEVTAVRFAEIGAWARTVSHSAAVAAGDPKVDPKVDPVTHAPVAGRTCDVSMPGFSSFTERIVRFEPDTHTIAYVVAEGMPGFVDEPTSTWVLERTDVDATSVAMTVSATTTGVMGLLARPFLRMNMRRTLRQVGDDLRQYVETGEVSSAKLRRIRRSS